MTKWILRLALIALLALVGMWGSRTLFPGPEQIIKQRLAKLAEAASTSGEEGLLAKAARVQRLTSFFTPDLEIVIDMPGEYNAEITGIDELTRMAGAARSMGRYIKVELVDINVMLNPDQNSAEAHMTGKATVRGENALHVQELKAQLRKVNGQWLVSRIESVRTLR